MNQVNTVFRFAVKDRDIIPLEEAVLPISVREVFFNFSVYESVKVLSGIPVFLEDHLDRLFESAGRLEISRSLSREEIADMAEALVTADELADATLRIQLIGGEIPKLFIFPQELARYPESLYREGAGAVSFVGERVVPEVKSNSLLLNYLAQREAERAGVTEALFVNRHGNAVEGTRSNLFAVSGHHLVTPGTGVLAGVTRKHILQVAEELGMTISYSEPPLKGILEGAYDTVFITSTSMGAMPLAWIDGVPIPAGFAVVRALHNRLHELEAGYIAGKR